MPPARTTRVSVPLYWLELCHTITDDHGRMNSTSQIRALESFQSAEKSGAVTESPAWVSIGKTPIMIDRANIPSRWVEESEPAIHGILPFLPRLIHENISSFG